MGLRQGSNRRQFVLRTSESIAVGDRKHRFPSRPSLESACTELSSREGTRLDATASKGDDDRLVL